MPVTPTQPDIILLVLDTHRADRLSCYGYPRGTSPHIDEFAQSATLFERAIVPAQWTIPSHASLFTGEYPTTHMVNQIYNTLGDDQKTLAELLKAGGYKTVGFCNNPLLGAVENRLDRGFEEFYNYGGAIPNPPHISRSRPRVEARLFERNIRAVRRLATRIYNHLVNNPLLVRVAMNPFLSSLWLRHGNFKGNTMRSLRDVLGYLRTYRKEEERQPLFVFINLMETHLPYWPPKRFIRRFAPYYRQDREAQAFWRYYRTQTYRWMLPLTEPLSEVADRVLNDFHDAEVAYQDRMLRHVFRYLNRPDIRDNTMVIITSDHGEGMNNHNFVGHSLVVYDDLVRAPLIIRYPKLYPAGKRVSSLVSTRRLFHSVLEAAQVMPNGNGEDESQSVPIDVHGLSLTRSLEHGPDPDGEYVFAEAYTPDTLMDLMKNRDDDAIEVFRCRFMRRAAYRGRYKLITVGDEPDELFDVLADPGETKNLIDEHPDQVADLANALTHFAQRAEERRPANWEAARQLSLEDDALADRLRALGYLE